MTVRWTGPQWLRGPAEALGLEIYHRATSLSLTGPKYDDRLVEHLAKLRCLESLALSNTQFSPEGVARLQRALPGCRIEWAPR